MKARLRPASGLSGAALASLAIGAMGWIAMPMVAKAAESVSARGWAHSEFGRFVLEWDKPVKYQANIRDGALRLRFDSPVSTDLSAAQRTLSRFLRSVSVSPDRRRITARLNGDFGLRHFANGNSVIVDLLAKKAQSAPRRNSRAPPSVLSVRTGEHNRFGRLVFDWTVAVRYSVSRAGQSVVIRFDKSAALDMGELRRRLPGQIKDVNVRTTSSGLEVRIDPAPGARVRHFRDGTRIVVDIIAAPGDRSPSAAVRPPAPADTPSPRTETATSGNAVARTSAAPPPRATVPPADGPVATEKQRGKQKFRPLISVDVSKQPTGLSVRFNWREKVSAAVYRRGDHLWLLFDKAARIDLGGIKIAGRGVVISARQISLPDSAWIGLEMSPKQRIAVHRKDNAWVLDLARGSGAITAPRSATVRVDRGKGAAAKVAVGVGQKARLYRVYDPLGGDELAIVPASDAGTGIPRPHRFVKFDLLETAVGVVVRKKADDVSVRLKGEALEVTAADGLFLSDEKSVKKPRTALAAPQFRKPLTYIKEWGNVGDQNITKGQKRLVEAILKSPPPKRNAARMQLAKFYLAHQMAGGAIGVLNIVVKQDQSYERDLDFRALRGAANYLLAHYVEAEDDLTFSFLKKERSIAPWLASVAVARGDWKSAHGLFAGTGVFLKNYPHWLATHMQLLAIEAALAANDLEIAKRRFKAIVPAALTDTQRLQLDYLKAFQLKKEGNPRQAIAVWKKLSKSNDRKVRAKSGFAATETLLEMKAIDAGKAIEQLEKLTYAWRGDSFEFDLLRRLGDLYSQRRNHRDALTHYRQAASYFDNVAGAEAMTQQMSKIFNGLYLKGDADKLSAVRALALYEEFRELTPAGEAGDEMIRRLADRLAAVDLLNEAAKLLEHQVKFRLQGPTKARVGARLALIRLLDLKPKDAIDALDESRIEGIAPELGRQRALLRAQALGRLGRTAEALATIKDDRGREAELLRVGIHWRKNQWSRAAEVLDRLLKDADTKRLDRGAGRLVLQRAIALVLAKQTAELDRLRRRFSKAMMQGPNAEAFEAIAGRDAGRIPDFRTLANKAGELAVFEAFMAEYRGQIKASQLSTIN